LYRVRAHFAHTHFLRFLFLAPADLLFILQASVARSADFLLSMGVLLVASMS
jgi:hypothetical protein